MGKLIGILVVVLVLVGGIYWWMNRDGSSRTSQGGAAVEEAMKSSQRMKCDYAMDMDGKTFHATVFTEGEKFKSIMQVDGMVVYALNDGTAQYTWNSKEKTGMKTAAACFDDVKKKASQNSGVQFKDAKGDFNVAKDVSCNPVEEADFSVPSDITFSDLCTLAQ